MKKMFLVVMMVVSLVIVSPVLAEKSAATGEDLPIGETEFLPDMLFHIAHGFAGKPRPDGRYKYKLEWNGEFVKFDIYEIYQDSETETWTWIWTFNFPEGLSGMHTFIHHWYGPCGEGCDQPNKIVEIYQRTQTVNFSIEAVERAALVALYLSTNGESWVNNTNWLDENIHHCSWYGVFCDGIKNVYYISLTNNQLSGSIPPEIGNLPNLVLLYLSRNQLNGSIPIQFSNLTKLAFLYLNNNQLTGSIPPELGNIESLMHLYLSMNLLTGTIPPELGNLPNLERLALYTNQLSGNIPIELGNLTNLQYLYLNTNQLNGCIPTELSNLSSLHTLALSSNSFNGWETQDALDWALTLTYYSGPMSVAETCP